MKPLNWIRRAVRTGVEKKLVSDYVFGRKAATLELAPLIARHGLNVRTMHTLYARTHPERLALVDSRQALTYAEADAMINRVAAALRDRLGVVRGTPVVLTMDNRVEYVLAWMALFRLGASCVHTSYRATVDELRYQVEHCRARVIIAGGGAVETARAAAEKGPIAGTKRPPGLVLVDVETRGTGAGEWRWDELVRNAPDSFVTAPRRGRGSRLGTSENIVYTSGTTGRPKGAVRDFAAFGLEELLRVLERLPVQAGDRHLVVAPLYHSGAQVFALIQTALGATLHLLERFEPQATLEALSKHRIHSVFMVPTMIHRVLELERAHFRDNPTPELRAIVSGAAPFSQALRNRAMDRFGAHTIFDFYGATELGWVTLIDGIEMTVRAGSVGRPLEGQEIRIVDDQGDDLPPGEPGLIYVRNAQTMAGYLNDARATAESRLGAWLTVEDMGYLDERGYLYLTGRKRDLIISAGVNIYPAEIEEVLLQHPAVREAAVVGVPDSEWGERVVAFVVFEGDAPGRAGDRAGDAQRTDERTAELEAHVRANLAGYKVPRSWEVVDALPRNPTGKVLKRELRERLLEA